MADFDPEQSGDVEVEQPSGPTVGTVPAGALPSYAALKAGKIESAGTDPALTKFVETPLVPTSVTKPLAEAIDFPTPQLTALSDALFPKLELGKTYEKYVTEPTAEQLSGLTSPANIAATVLTGGLEGLFRKPRLAVFDPVKSGDVPVPNAVFRTTEGAGVPRVSAEDMRPVAAEPLIQATTPAEEVIPSASQITSPTGITSGEVRPSVDEEAPLRQPRETAETRPQSEEVPQEVGQPTRQGARAEAFRQMTQRLTDEQTGQAILDRLSDQGTTPRDVVDQFWKDTYYKLDGKTQAKFQRYIENQTGMRPGETIGTDAKGNPIKAQDWQDAFPSSEVSPDIEHLEGTDRGLISLMAAANEHVRAAPTVAPEVGQRADVMALAEQGAPTNAPIPDWAREEMIRRGLSPGRTFNDVDLANPSVREAIQLDPTMTAEQKAEVLRTGSKPPATPTAPKVEAAPVPEPQSITSIKNEQVDAERAARNLPPVVQPARKAFGASWDEASKKIDDNPNYPDQLIGELKSKPRALTDVEDATLLHRQVDLQNQYQKGAAALFKATEAGDEVGRLEASARVNALSDQLSELYDVGKKAGTETGRGLAARKLLAAEDFSLANMVTQKRAALQGAQLSEEQVAQVNTAKNKVSAAQIALDAYETSPKAEGYRKRLATLAEQYRARTAAGDFAPPQRTPIPLDKDLERRQADLARAKKDWYTELAKDQAKNRTASQKFWDRFVGVERAMKLSSDVVLAKLTAAAAVREGALTPVEETVGGGISKILPGLAKRAPREGGFSLDAEVRAKAAMFTDGMKDAWQNLKMKQTNLDELYKSGRIKAPDEFYDYLGYLHGAMKAPVKRAEFTRSLIKRMKWATENRQDLNNVNTMRAISEEAYVDANRSIFLQDNIVSDVFTGALRMAEKNKKAPNLGPAVARIGRFLVPIVKVPTNIVGEVATGVHGLATGGTRAAAAYIKGIESLPTAQADSIMRQLKKGAIGNALLLTGYFGYKSIGGFYHDQDKRTAADVQAGRYRVGNVDIPASAGHSTGAMLLNIGATVHRVQDERIKKTEPETKGLGAGVIAAGQGLAHEVPFVPAVTGIADALGSKNGLEKYIMNMVSSTTTPALVTHVAKIIDTPGTFPQNILQPATPRKPTNPVEAFETTIPGLRERVPERKLRGSTSGGDYIR